MSVCDLQEHGHTLIIRLPFFLLFLYNEFDKLASHNIALVNANGAKPVGMLYNSPTKTINNALQTWKVMDRPSAPSTLPWPLQVKAPNTDT